MQKEGEKMTEQETERKEDLGLREQREGDLGAEEGKKEQDWGQRRGKERQGAFPHQMRSDRPN